MFEKQILICCTCCKKFVNGRKYHMVKYCSDSCRKKSVSLQQKSKMKEVTKYLHSKQAQFKSRMKQIGKHHSPETQFKKGNVGSKSGNWKGGRIIHNGYVLIYSPNHPNCNKSKYVPEHKLNMEKKIGRFLLPREVVHHINGKKDDNRIENLMYFSCESEHQKFHRSYSLINSGTIG